MPERTPCKVRKDQLWAIGRVLVLVATHKDQLAAFRRWTQFLVVGTHNLQVMDVHAVSRDVVLLNSLGSNLNRSGNLLRRGIRRNFGQFFRIGRRRLRASGWVRSSIARREA